MGMLNKIIIILFKLNIIKIMLGIYLISSVIYLVVKKIFFNKFKFINRHIIIVDKFHW